MSLKKLYIELSSIFRPKQKEPWNSLRKGERVRKKGKKTERPYLFVNVCHTFSSILVFVKQISMYPGKRTSDRSYLDKEERDSARRCNEADFRFVQEQRENERLLAEQREREAAEARRREAEQQRQQSSK